MNTGTGTGTGMCYQVSTYGTRTVMYCTWYCISSRRKQRGALPALLTGFSHGSRSVHRALMHIHCSLSAFTRLHKPSIRLSSAPIAAEIGIRLAEPSDLTQLTELTTSALYGEVDIFRDGPIMAMQRQQIVQKQRSALSRRLGFEGTKYDCRFFVAVEQTEFGDRICGCIDLAVHLFDQTLLSFELQKNSMPPGGEDRYRWAPYLASVSVNRSDRQSGIGRQLVRAAEGFAVHDGYKEVMLEVSQLNEDALKFYDRMGYSILSSFNVGEAGGGAVQVMRQGIRWELQQTGKHVLRKSLSGPSRRHL